MVSCISTGSEGENTDVIDIEGTYANWMAELDANYFIVRADFHVAATAKTASELSSCFDCITDRLHMSYSTPAFAAQGGAA